MIPRSISLPILRMAMATVAGAEDWPEWRGKGRTGVWDEDGIVQRFPPGGLAYTWRTPVRGGYSGPAVAGGRVFVTDYEPGEGLRGTERALCLDEGTGRVLWTREWQVDQAGTQPTWAIGPRATPTVDGPLVYVLGTMGDLLALSVKTGEVAWRKSFQQDYGTGVPAWGMTGAPIVVDDLLIAVVGGGDGAFVVGFSKTTGEEVWRALSSEHGQGYSAPLLIERGGVRQLIVWHPVAVSSLDPATGRVLWEQPFEVRLCVATPVFDGEHLLVSSFFNGSMMLGLSDDPPAARVLWRGQSDSEIDTDGLHALITTPVIDAMHVYGICSYGQLRALEVSSGVRVWESQQAVGEKARWASGFIVRQGKRYFINTDRGDLVIARLTPEGYVEIDRTRLIEPTTSGGGRRELKAVHWSHPAYANGHIIVRNDREIVRASLLSSTRADE